MYHLYLDLFSAKSARQNRTPEQEETRDDVNLKQNYEQKYLWEIHRSVDTEQYRNVAIEVWEEDKNGKKSQNMDHHLHSLFLKGALCGTTVVNSLKGGHTQDQLRLSVLERCLP